MWENSPADAQHMIGGSCHAQASAGAASQSRAALKSSVGREARSPPRTTRHHSGHETGSHGEAVPPRTASPYRIRVDCCPVRRRIHMLPEPGKHRMRKLIYTTLVKYNRTQCPMRCLLPVMRPELRQTKTRLPESSNVARPYGWHEPPHAGAPLAGRSSDRSRAACRPHSRTRGKLREDHRFLRSSCDGTDPGSDPLAGAGLRTGGAADAVSRGRADDAAASGASSSSQPRAWPGGRPADDGAVAYARRSLPVCRDGSDIAVAHCPPAGRDRTIAATAP